MRSCGCARGLGRGGRRAGRRAHCCFGSACIASLLRIKMPCQVVLTLPAFSCAPRSLRSYMSEEVQAAVAAQKPPSKLVVKIARSRNNLC